MLNVIQVFASSIVGANSDAVDNDSQASDQTEGAKKDNYYKVVGTIFDPEKNEKPAWVHEGFKVYHMQCPAVTCKLLAANTRKNLTTCSKSANKLSKVVFTQLVSSCQQVWNNLLSTGNKGKHLYSNSTCHEKYNLTFVGVWVVLMFYLWQLDTSEYYEMYVMVYYVI